MSNNSSWKRDVRGIVHPVENLLLAFIRGECPENEKRIQAHLINCGQCSQAFADLLQRNRALNYLKQMSLDLRYPELKPELVLAHAQRGVPLRSAWTGRRRQEAKRPHGHKGALRLVSLPAAFGLGLLFMSVIAYAFVASHYSRIVTPGGANTNPAWSMGTGVVQHSPPSMLKPSPSASATKAPTTGATGTVQTLPSIENCSSSANLKYHLLAICGYGFKPGSKVVLITIVLGRKQPPIPSAVDAKGAFRVVLPWSKYGCRYPPASIFAEDTSRTPYMRSNILTNSAISGCPTPTPTPTGAYSPFTSDR